MKLATRRLHVAIHRVTKSNKHPSMACATPEFDLANRKRLQAKGLDPLTHPASLPKRHYLELGV